jgi:hypothetical protein
MSNFLILSLPRSRTAWLANFLTYDDLQCSHEGIGNYETLDEYNASLLNNMGDSNTCLAAFDFEDYFIDTKIVIIDNTIDAAVAFEKKEFDVDTSAMLKILKNRLDGISGLHINFNDINNSLEEIWNYLSDKPFNKERADMLIGFDIQMRDVHDMKFKLSAKFHKDFKGVGYGNN